MVLGRASYYCFIFVVLTVCSFFILEFYSISDGGVRGLGCPQQAKRTAVGGEAVIGISKKDIPFHCLPKKYDHSSYVIVSRDFHLNETHTLFCHGIQSNKTVNIYGKSGRFLYYW